MRATQKIIVNATAKKTTNVTRGLILSRIDPPPEDDCGTVVDTVGVTVGFAVGVAATI
jgi:hypothetical protein